LTQTALALAILVAAAWASGAAAASAFAWPGLRRAERASLEIAAGLGIVSLTLSAALLLHLFAWATALLVFLAISSAALAVRWRRIRGAPAADLVNLPLARHATFAIAACAIVACAGAIAPVTDHDALSYVVPIARHMAREGALRVWSDQAPSMWPQGHTVLLAFIVQRGGDRLGALSAVEWLTAVGAASAFARRASERAEHVPLAVALAIAAPAAAFQVAAAKEDPLLLAATAGALFCLAGPPTVRESAAAGFFAGLAAGVKYPGLGVAIAVVAWSAIQSWRIRRVAPAVAALASALAIGGVWYALNVLRYGNPVAPFVFGAPRTPLDAAAVRQALAGYGGGQGAIAFVITPLHVFLDPSSYGGRAQLFHPAVYAAVAALFAAPRRSRAAPLLLTAGVLYVGWFLTLQNARLLLPAAMALSPAAADALAPAMRRSRATCAAILVAVGAPMLLAPAIGVVRAARYVRDPASYLERETEHYSGVAWANAHLDPARHRILSLFGVVGYFSVPAIGVDPLHQLEFDRLALADNRRLLDECRARGVTHVFANPHEFDDVATQVRMVYLNPASRLGDAHFFRPAPVAATAIFEVLPAAPERR
jgi:hypothetical protein